MALALTDLRGGYLFQNRPDIIPEGYMTDVEVQLWVKYYKNKENK